MAVSSVATFMALACAGDGRELVVADCALLAVVGLVSDIWSAASSALSMPLTLSHGLLRVHCFRGECTWIAAAGRTGADDSLQYVLEADDAEDTALHRGRRRQV